MQDASAESVLCSNEILARKEENRRGVWPHLINIEYGLLIYLQTTPCLFLLDEYECTRANACDTRKKWSGD